MDVLRTLRDVAPDEMTTYLQEIASEVRLQNLKLKTFGVIRFLEPVLLSE